MIAFRRRLRVPAWLPWIAPLASAVVALLLWSALLAVLGHDPAAVFEIVGQTFARLLPSSSWAQGPPLELTDTLHRSTPIVLCAAGIALAASIGLHNIGAEGQLHVGAMAATWAALAWSTDPSGPSTLALLSMGALAALAGGIWCGACGLLRARFGASEILTTLMLNHVAILWAEHLLHGPWKGPGNFPYTETFPAAATLPTVGDSTLHLGVLVPLAAVVVLAVLGRWSVWGFENRVAGASWSTARYAGIAVGRRVVVVMAIAGALAGLAGMIQVAGVGHRLQPDVSPGYGYTAIVVCWLGRARPLRVALVGVLLSALTVAGEIAEFTLRLPVAATEVLGALVLLCVLAGDLLVTHRPTWIPRARPDGDPTGDPAGDVDAPGTAP